jgi:light-regulated signal transduction histidine kinase (bacteriophytochrome)
LAEALAELERVRADQEQFVYAASHDLQEPLRAIRGFAQLLQRRCHGKLDAESEEFLGFLLDGVERMQQMVNDLLAYSRVGSRAESPAAVDANTAADEAAASLQTATLQSGGRVTRDALPTVCADRRELVLLLEHLISNGIKFCGDDPPDVHVSAAKAEDAWRFSVRDNGIGIDPKHADQVFVIFRRLHGREDYPGTGIGLALCKRIVERHGGRIWVESEPGEGSTFYFTIPDGEQTATPVGGRPPG